MKAKKLRKVILSFALSAALLAQPMAGMPVVLAEETQTADQLTGDSNSDDIVKDSQTGNSEDADQGDFDDPDNKDDEAKDPGKEDGNGEEDKETDDSTERESGDTTDGENPDDPSKDEGDEGKDDSTEEPEDETAEDKSISGNEIDGDETKEKEDDLDKDSAMPEGYKLTSFQRELKAELGNILGQFSESDEGETYAERRVFTFAGSQEEAEMIAEAYNAEIIEFDMGVLTLKLSNGVSVKSALMEASDLDNNLPAVWPDYRRELYGEVAPETAENAIPGLEVEEEEYSIEDETAPQQESEDGVPSPEAYEQALNELDAYNDPYLQRTSTSYQWFHNTIGSVYAWDAGYTGQNIKVGVVDSGVDSNGDLNANVFGKTDFCDGTTAAADCAGKDSKGNDIKHGTHVAGIIAAVANNNSGGAGVAPNAKVYNAKVFGNTESKSGYDSTIARAILYLINENENVALDKLDNNVDPSKEPRVDIINMSLGGPGQNPAMQRVFNKAYKKGVIVFAAAGNDGGSLVQYPASYNNVISVAATDTNNGRAYFSNYGSTVDLAAPGVGIYSTDGSGFGSKQGTSMACPVVAGEAAVILSGQAALSALNGKTGQARVKAVESIMKSNTISAGSGMGKGITSLPKVFKLSTAAAKPNAPKITPKNASTDTEQKMNITIEAQAGMKICYTTDGKNPVFLKDGTTGTGTYLVTTNTKTITVNGKDAAKGTIKAIAVNASGTISSVKSYKYTLKPFVEKIEVSGPKRVEQGKTIQLAATVTPTYADNKAVEWKLTQGGKEVDPAAQIKIDAKGKITTKTGTAVGTYTVTATAKDGSKITGTYTIDVIQANTGIQKIAFAKDVQKELWLGVSGGNTVSLLPKLTAEVKGADGKNKEAAITTVESNLSWTSSKSAVATVNDKGIVTAKAVGTTTITVKTDDNLAKKATVNITVKQAVTGITIAADNFSVAAGKSLALKANLAPVKPTNNKVNWSIAPASGNTDGETEIANKNIAINKANGKITVKAAAKTGNYTVTAEAADGKGAKDTKTITIVAGAIGEIKLDNTKVTLSTTSADGGTTQTKITATIKGVKGKETDFLETAYKVTNSNPSVVTAVPTLKAKGTVEIALSAVHTKYGKANIVIASTDGSNKKATCVVTVSGGISKVEVVDGPSSTKKVSKLTLFRKGVVSTAPGTATIYAKITGSNGANKTAYDVTSSDPRLVAVSYNTSTDRIDLTASSVATGKATITVMATDGSKKKASCTVTVVNPASKINIAPKASASPYVAYGKSLQLTATLETDHGAVASKAVAWSVPKTVGKDNIPTDQILTVNSSTGKVTVKKNANVLGGIPVTATAKDGSGLTATYNVGIVPPTTEVLLAWNVKYKGWLATATVGKSVEMPFISDCYAPMMVTSSTPSVASPSISYDSETGLGSIYIVANKKGKTTITVKALDGTGKSDKMVLWVNK